MGMTDFVVHSLPRVVMTWCLAALLAICVGVLLAFCSAMLRKVFKKCGVALIAVCALCCIYARKGMVEYPRTNPDLQYLVDRGSSVNSNYVHLAFSKLMVPDGANMIVMHRLVSETNNPYAYSETFTTTFHEFDPDGNGLVFEGDFIFADATNYDFMVFTDWIPGQTVVTNGVYHLSGVMHSMTNDIDWSEKYVFPLMPIYNDDGIDFGRPKLSRPEIEGDGFLILGNQNGGTE